MAFMKSSPPPKENRGRQFYWALPLGDLKFLPTSGELSQMGGLKFFIHFFMGGAKRQSLLNFVYLFQIKFNFSIENIFSESYHDIKNTLICKVNFNLGCFILS